MTQPKVSVIIPVYNTEKYLRESLDCIVNQSLKEIEIICVDDSSTDSSYEILQEYAARDERFQIVRQANAGAGAARNNGFRRASGEYAFFFDADDLCAENLLELTYHKAAATDADIVAFDFYRFTDPAKKTRACGVHTDWLKEEKETFCYRDMPDRILSAVYACPWNKLFKASFIRDHGLQYEEISSSNDITFAVVSVAMASRIAAIREPLVSHRIGHAGTITSTKKKNTNNVWLAISAVTRQIEVLPYYEMIRGSLWRFEIDSLYVVFRDFMGDLKSDSARELYEKIHTFFNSEHFSGLQNDGVGNPKYYQSFEIIRSHDYEEMVRMKEAKIVVSVTSYPARIDCVAKALSSIYKQTRQPDVVALYLAGPQFPGQDADLPEELKDLIAQGRLTVRFVPEDLKPHKKYLYAMQDYPEDLIITIDDDLLYASDMIACLYESYLQYPKAVSAIRTHLITFRNDETLAPYNEWIQESDGCMYRPSMQLLCTGGAGALYPPHIFDETVLDKEAIARTCPDADDLWLKANELVCGIPVVLARKIDPLMKLPDSQDSALWYTNVIEGKNDKQWKDISDYMDGKYGEGILRKMLTAEGFGERILDPESLYRHFREAARHPKNQAVSLQRRLDTAYAQKSEINAKLQRTYHEKSEINAKLQQTYHEKSDINRQLKETREELARVKKELKELKDKQGKGGLKGLFHK